RFEGMDFPVTPSTFQVAKNGVAIEGPDVIQHFIVATTAETVIEVDCNVRSAWQYTVVEVQPPFDMSHEYLPRGIIAEQTEGLQDLLTSQDELFRQVDALEWQQLLGKAPGQMAEYGDTRKTKLA